MATKASMNHRRPLETISPLRGVTARFVSRNFTFPFPTIALISHCLPRRIMFFLHEIKLLANSFQIKSLKQNSELSIYDFKKNRPKAIIDNQVA
jgi:hypothetical protein